MPRRVATLLALAAAVVSVVAPREARACAVCGAAERALPTNGAEVPFEGRRRATFDGRAAAFATRAEYAVHVTELRAEAGAGVAVSPSTMIGVDIPVLRRVVTSEQPRPQILRPASSDRVDHVILGDVELRLSHVAWRNADGRRLTLVASAKGPTAPIEHDPTGAPVAPDLQPGCGSIVPSAAATYAWMGSLVSFWTTASFLFPVSVREGPHPGDSLRASGTLQLQPTDVLATRFGAHARYDTTAELDGAVVSRSGGASTHVSTEIVYSPTMDVVIAVGAAFPVVQGMRAYRSTSPVALASVGVDF